MIFSDFYLNSLRRDWKIESFPKNYSDLSNVAQIKYLNVNYDEIGTKYKV